jgi:hypothetical protein
MEKTAEMQINVGFFGSIDFHNHKYSQQPTLVVEAMENAMKN